MYKYILVQIYTCTNVSLYIYILPQIHPFTKVRFMNVKIHKCINVHEYMTTLDKCTNVQMDKCTNVQMYKCTNVQMYKCLKTKLFHHQDLDPQG